MKKYEVYKNIRRQALIFGLPLTYFALQMVAVIGSLMTIIFSFSLGLIFMAILVNLTLFVFLTRITVRPISISLVSVFPKCISNQRANICDYVNY